MNDKARVEIGCGGPGAADCVDFFMLDPVPKGRVCRPGVLLGLWSGSLGGDHTQLTVTRGIAASQGPADRGHRTEKVELHSATFGFLAGLWGGGGGAVSGMGP